MGNPRDIEGFEIADPDGVFITLSEREARACLAWLNEEAEWGEPLSPALEAMRSQLGEWVSPTDEED